MRKNNVIFFFLSLGFAFSIFVLSRRIALEKTLNTIETAVDFADIRRLAGISGKSAAEIMPELKDVGITSVGVEESTVRELNDRGLVILADGREVNKWKYIFNRSPDFLESQQIANKADYTYIFTENPSLGMMIKTALLIKLPGVSVVGTYTGRYYLVIARADKLTVENIGLGFWEEEVSAVKAAGFNYILRPSHDPLVTDAWIETLFDKYAGDEKLTGILPSGNRIPGAAEKLAEEAGKLNMAFGTVEFAQIAGAMETAAKLGKTFLCFSPKGENASVKIKACLRSLRERNVQLIYIHPAEETYSEFLAYAGAIKRGLSENSFRSGKFTALPLWDGDSYSFLLISLATLAGALWLLSIIANTGRQFEIAYVVIALACSIFFSASTSWRLFIAFLATVTFPVLAISKTWAKPELPPLTGALWLFLKVSFISLLGGIFVSAILSSTDFMVKINTFRGVKLSLILPPALAFVILYGRERSYFSTSLSRLWHKRLEVRHLFFGIGIAVFLLLMILRSSNKMSFVLPFEMEVREALEKFFFARPRFKEFAVGHPLMIMGFYFYAKAPKIKKIHFRPLIILGLIGQVSIINTFAHIHSPIGICLFRTVNGIALGALLGALLIAADGFFKFIDHK
ncbi:MAG: hypothetical protein CVU78_04170 [Elusimicrobia bacterium HGW-Elusimicrobia-2]|nr:MAG: hypothetical protein CVU78_04170 [Elusimicrobia bacterium HGW-Elusimicrobia-2]